MAKRLGKFEVPNRLVKVEEGTNYAKFIAEPFEKGFGWTIGNVYRRVLLSSIEGAAISSLRFAIPDITHEFQSIDGVVEDVTEIILNLKRVLLKSSSRESVRLVLEVNKEGVVEAGDIQPHADIEIINPKQIICTLDTKQHLLLELDVLVGRGYRPAEDNKKDGSLIGLIPMDCQFSPIIGVQYAVENTRVGKITDFDKLTLGIMTDGRISADDALQEATKIIQHHLQIFERYNHQEIQFETEQKVANEQDNRFKSLLNLNVNEIELSVRSSNCLNNAKITRVGELVIKTEAEMLKYRNFGKKSLNEIKAKLEQLGLSLGMHIDPQLLTNHPTAPQINSIEQTSEFQMDRLTQRNDFLLSASESKIPQMERS